MGQTTIYQLPYPEQADVADVPIDMKELADRIEAVIKPGTADQQVPLWNNTTKTWDATLLASLANLFNFKALYDSTLAASAGSIDTGAGGVPQTAKHLLCIWKARSDRAIAVEDAVFRFNNLSGGTDYGWQHLSAAVAAVTAAESMSSQGLAGSMAAASSGANVYGVGFLFMPNYSAAGAELRNYVAVGGSAGAATGQMGVRIVAGICRTGGPISRAALLPSVGPNLVSGSRLSIYGIG